MRERLLSLYRKLKTEHRARETGHGTLNPKLPDWWPADSPFEVMVGAILTQNTNWRNAGKAIANLKSAGILEANAILKTENSKLETLIRPSGFYRQKTERLKLATEKWKEVWNRETGNSKLDTAELSEAWGQNSGLKTQDLRNEWLSVKGIGKETADSILLYAFGRPLFVIDAYTRRFCDYHDLFCGKEYDEYRLFFESNLPRSVPLYKEYHALIVEWGKRNPNLKTRI